MPDDLQTTVRNAMTNVPAYLKRGIDNTGLKVREKAGTSPYDGHASIAYVDPDEPNTINVGNAKQFQGMTPAQQTATLAHELTHRLVANAPPTIQKSLKPVNYADPYSYDANNLKGKNLSSFSQEQLAHMVETNTNYQNTPTPPGVDPKAWAARQQQIAQSHDPVLQQLQQMPTATINTDNSQQSSSTPLNPGTINTAVNPPNAMYESAPPITPTLNGPVGQTPVDNSQWEDVPQNGSQSSPESDWEDVGPQQTIQQGNQHALQQGIVGAGKGLAGDLIMGTPAAGLLMSGELGHGLDSSNSDQTAGKVANAGVQMAAGGGADAVEGLINLAKTGIGKVTGSGAIDALHSSFADHLQSVAQEAGVEVKPTDNVRKVVSNTADAIRAKATEKMDAVDDAFKGLKFNARGAGGKFATGSGADLGYPENFSGFDEQISKLNDKLRSSPGAANIEKRAALNAQIKELTSAKSQASNALDRQGLGGAREEADKLFQQADELDNLKAAHNRSTFGMPGRTNPIKFEKELQSLHSTGQLETAVGPSHSESLMDSASRASRTYGRTQTAQKIAKGIGATAVRAAGYGAGMDLFK